MACQGGAVAHISPSWSLVLLQDIPQRYGLSTSGESVTQENKEQLCELCVEGALLRLPKAAKTESFVPVGSWALILMTQRRMCSFTFEK